MQDACTRLLSPEKKKQQPTQAFTAEQLWAEKAPPSHHLVARTLLWLSVCVASGARLWDTGLSTNAGVFSTAHAAAVPSAVPAADCFGRALRLVQLYTALHPRLQKEVRGPMVLLAAHVLQPAAAMLLGTPLDGRNAANQVCSLQIVLALPFGHLRTCCDVIRCHKLRRWDVDFTVACCVVQESEISSRTDMYCKRSQNF